MEETNNLITKKHHIYLNILLFFVLTIVVVNNYQTQTKESDDPHRNKGIETSKLWISIVLLFSILGYIVLYFTKNITEGIDVYYYGVLGILASVYGYISLSSYRLFNYVMNIVLIVIGIVGLAIVFNVFMNFFKSLRGFTSFMSYLVFYIPCILLDFVNYIIREFKLTTNPVLVLFGIEICLLLIYLYSPKVMQQFANKDGKNVLEKIVLLNEENIFPMDEIIMLDTKTNSIADNGVQVIRKNYGLSMWVYLNNFSTSMSAYNKETLIFDYGRGKPKITFFNDENEIKKMDTYRFYFSDKLNSTNHNENFHEIKMPSQKWNHIFFNYTSRNVEIYINGKLERTFNLKDSVPTYNIGDVITTGSTNGLNGAISNIRYYEKNLSNRDIVNIYNLLMNKDPPVNNL